MLHFFFFNDPATTEIYTLSLHDALPISQMTGELVFPATRGDGLMTGFPKLWETRDRKSTRLNSSHQIISYAVFCLKKKMNAVESDGSGLQRTRSLSISYFEHELRPSRCR